MSDADTKTPGIKTFDYGIGAAPWNMSKSVVTRVGMLTHSDRIQVGVVPTGRGHDHVSGWHDKPIIACSWDGDRVGWTDGES